LSTFILFSLDRAHTGQAPWSLPDATAPPTAWRYRMGRTRALTWLHTLHARCHAPHHPLQHLRGAPWQRAAFRANLARAALARGPPHLPLPPTGQAGMRGHAHLPAQLDMVVPGTGFAPSPWLAYPLLLPPTTFANLPCTLPAALNCRTAAFRVCGHTALPHARTRALPHNAAAHAVRLAAFAFHSFLLVLVDNASGTL